MTLDMPLWNLNIADRGKGGSGKERSMVGRIGAGSESEAIVEVSAGEEGV